MKNVLALILIGSIGVSVLGFIAINHSMDHSNSGCVLFAMGGASCPLRLIDMAIHHILAFQQFSNFLLPFSSATADILYVLLLFVVLYLILKNLSPGYFDQQNHFQKLYANKSSVFDIYATKTMRYLSLLENSPSFLRGV